MYERLFIEYDKMILIAKTFYNLYFINLYTYQYSKFLF